MGGALLENDAGNRRQILNGWQAVFTQTLADRPARSIVAQLFAEGPANAWTTAPITCLGMVRSVGTVSDPLAGAVDIPTMGGALG